MSSGTKTDIITVPSLQSYFYESLCEVNNTSLCPVLNEALFYSSDVLDKFSHSAEYYEYSEGRVKEKILGEMFLEAQLKSLEEQKRIYKDIGDTSLILCGYFSESINKKIVDKSYYKNLGVTAYQRLNSVVPTVLDVPSFFKVMASSFDAVTGLISIVASKDQSDPHRHLIFDKLMKGEELSEQELLVAKVIPQKTKKVS